MERHEELTNLAKAAKALAAAEVRVHDASEALRAHPIGARSGQRGGKTATLTARLRTACEARDRAGAEFEAQLVSAGFHSLPRRVREY
jgi:hypothetical protein